MAQSTLSLELGFAAPSSFLPWLRRCNDSVVDGATPPSPARLDDGGVAVLMVVDGDIAARCALQVKVAQRRKMVGGCHG